MSDEMTDKPPDTIPQLRAAARRTGGYSRSVPHAEVREAFVHIDEQAREIATLRAENAQLRAIFAEPIPCDVMLPPATIFRKGVSLQTIRAAIDQRRTAPNVAVSFDSPREVSLSPGWLLRDIHAAAERFELEAKAPGGDYGPRDYP